MVKIPTFEIVLLLVKGMSVVSIYGYVMVSTKVIIFLKPQINRHELFYRSIVFAPEYIFVAMQTGG